MKFFKGVCLGDYSFHCFFCFFSVVIVFELLLQLSLLEYSSFRRAVIYFLLLMFFASVYRRLSS